MIQMLDKALNLLGPDDELLTEILTELGAKHASYGVKPDYFPIMGEALIYMLKDQLKDTITPEIEKAWKEVYSELSKNMSKTCKNEMRKKSM